MKWMICLLFFATAASGNDHSTGDHRFVLDIDGKQREYVVHIPNTYDPLRPFPVVLMFHGGGGQAKAAMIETGWADKADEARFLAVFPEGTRPDSSRPERFRDNPQSWNDGSGRFYAGRHGIDDVNFTRVLLDDLERRFMVDRQRIYVTGFSNGSSMAYRLGIELADRLAAIAPVASSGLRLEPPELLDYPVSLLAIQGSADPRNPIEGGDQIRSLDGTLDPRPPIRETIRIWAKMLDCPQRATRETDEQGLKTIDWHPCRNGSEVSFLVIDGMGHTWPGGRSLLPESLVGRISNRIKAVDVIWNFFQQHPRAA